MKKYLVVALILVATSVAAMDFETVVNTITSFKVRPRNGNSTYTTNYTAPVSFMTYSSGCRVFLNASSATGGMPVVAGKWYKWQMTPATSKLIFACSSTIHGQRFYVVK